MYFFNFMNAAVKRPMNYSKTVCEIILRQQ